MALSAMVHVSTEKQLAFDWEASELRRRSNGDEAAKTEHLAFDAAEIKGNEAAKRQLLVAAASGVPARLTGPDELVRQFRRLAEELGVELRKDKEHRCFVIETIEPTKRERESKRPGTSSEAIRKALADMSDQVPHEMGGRLFGGTGSRHPHPPPGQASYRTHQLCRPGHRQAGKHRKAFTPHTLPRP